MWTTSLDLLFPDEVKLFLSFTKRSNRKSPLKQRTWLSYFVCVLVNTITSRRSSVILKVIEQGYSSILCDECALSNNTGTTVDARLILVHVALVQVQFEPKGENYSFTRTTSLPPHPHFLRFFQP